MAISEKMMVKRMYILYDGRAAGGDTDDASVLEALGMYDKKPRIPSMWADTDCVMFSYKVVGSILTDERQET